MKKHAILILLFIALILVSCKKEDKNDYKFPCNPGECPTCVDDAFMHPDSVSSDYQVDFVEELEFSANCNCLVKGLVKYRLNGQTTALVWYGDGECDNLAVRTLCVDGDCEDENAVTCQIEMTCE